MRAFIVDPSQPADQTVAAGSNATFSVTAGGTGPFTYLWTFNGTQIPGATQSTYTRTGVSTNDQGVYRVNVGNSFNSVGSRGATLTVTSAPPAPGPVFGAASQAVSALEATVVV